MLLPFWLLRPSLIVFPSTFWSTLLMFAVRHYNGMKGAYVCMRSVSLRGHHVHNRCYGNLLVPPFQYMWTQSSNFVAVISAPQRAIRVLMSHFVLWASTLSRRNAGARKIKIYCLRLGAYTKTNFESLIADFRCPWPFAGEYCTARAKRMRTYRVLLA